MEFGADKLTPLKRAAKNKDERRFTLDHWLKEDWAAEDVGQLTRIEGSTPGWRMRTVDEVMAGELAAPMSGTAAVKAPKKKVASKPGKKAGKKKPK